MKTDARIGSGSVPSALLRLTRWREHVPYVVPLTLIGGLIACRATNTGPGLELAAVLGANLLANCMAFMINDIEDADDDARDPKRALRNVVASGGLSRGAAWIATIVCGLASLALYAVASGSGLAVLACGTATLLLAVAYSWRPIRLKAQPGVDVVSHALMLGGLLLLAAHLAQAPGEGTWVLPVTAVSLISAYGQFHNQIRDFDADKAAGLRNTAISIGLRATWVLLYACLAGAGLSIAAIVLTSIIPGWTFAVAAVAGSASWYLRSRTRADMRGAVPLDTTAEAQMPVLDGFNAMAFAWLAAVLMAH